MSEKALLMNGKEYGVEVVQGREVICRRKLTTAHQFHPDTSGEQVGGHRRELDMLVQLVAAGAVTRVR